MRERADASSAIGGILLLTKVSDTLSSINRNALMSIARTRKYCLRGIPIARPYYSAAKMEKRDYAVGQQQCASGLS
jgi:hypothetical protein